MLCKINDYWSEDNCLKKYNCLLKVSLVPTSIRKGNVFLAG